MPQREKTLAGPMSFPAGQTRLWAEKYIRPCFIRGLQSCLRGDVMNGRTREDACPTKGPPLLRCYSISISNDYPSRFANVLLLLEAATKKQSAYILGTPTHRQSQGSQLSTQPHHCRRRVRYGHAEHIFLPHHVISSFVTFPSSIGFPCCSS